MASILATRSKPSETVHNFSLFLHFCLNVTKKKWLQISPIDKRRTSYKKIYKEMGLKRKEFVAIGLDIGLLRSKSDQFIINHDIALSLSLNTKGVKFNQKVQLLSGGRQVKVFLFYFEEEFFTNAYPVDRQQLKQVVNKHKNVIQPSSKKRKITSSPIPTHARSRVVSPSPTTNASLESNGRKREDYIRFCNTLDFSVSKRRNRYDGEEIIVKNRKKQVTEEMKNTIIMICIEYGYSTLSKKDRMLWKQDNS